MIRSGSSSLITKPASVTATLGVRRWRFARWVIATDPTAEQPDCPVALPPAGSARLDAGRRQLPTMLAPKTAHDYGSWAGRYYAWLHQRQIVSAEVKATASGRD